MNDIITLTATYLVYIIAVLAVFVWLRVPREQKELLLVSAVLAIVIGIIMVKIAGMLYYHPRPFVAWHIMPLIAHGNNNGFPSDHTFASALMAFVIAQVSWRWGAALFTMALAVGWARVAAFVHWPIDIVGGVAVAALAVWLANIITRRIILKYRAMHGLHKHEVV